MSDLLFGHTADVAAFVAQFGERVDFGKCQAIGFLNPEGVLEAGVVYHDWNPEAEVIEMSGASVNPRWLTRERGRLIFDYPFHQIGCQAVYTRTTPGNKAVRRIMKAVGSNEYELPRLLGRDKSLIISVLTAERWEITREGQLADART